MDVGPPIRPHDGPFGVARSAPADSVRQSETTALGRSRGSGRSARIGRWLIMLFAFPEMCLTALGKEAGAKNPSQPTAMVSTLGEPPNGMDRKYASQCAAGDA